MSARAMRKLGRPALIVAVFLLVITAGVAVATASGFIGGGTAEESNTTTAPGPDGQPRAVQQPKIPEGLEKAKGNLPDSLVSSPVSTAGGTIAALGSGDRVDILRESGDDWKPQAQVQLESFVDPDSVVQSADVTGDGQPDFLVTQSAASASIGSVVSQQGGQWRVIPFLSNQDGAEYNTETYLRFQDGQVMSRQNSCEPSCAFGTFTDYRWRFDGTRFVIAN